MLLFLKGAAAGDAHAYLFWHNADPTDAPHRNLYAVRWKQWRLVKYPDRWKLFDLRRDPREERDTAGNHPDVVAAMRARYDAFVAELPPLKPSADFMGNGRGEAGWGWIMGNGR